MWVMLVWQTLAWQGGGSCVCAKAQDLLMLPVTWQCTLTRHSPPPSLHPGVVCHSAIHGGPPQGVNVERVLKFACISEPHRP